MKISTTMARELMIVALLTASSATIAQAQEACTTYKVAQGDTLSAIAQSAYNTFDYQAIFNANREKLKDNLGSLPIGLELVLPCTDGRLSENDELSAVIQAETAKQEELTRGKTTYEPPLKFVSSNGWIPFTDESLPGGGILVRLAETAMQRGGNTRSATVAFVDDWMSHLDSLLPSRAFDISVAWDRPDCSKLDLLGDLSQRMCTEFEFTDPIYEAVNFFVTLPDSKYASARDFSDYAGARVCRPEGWPTADLEVQGVVPPAITMIQPKDHLDCAKMVLNGEADLYTIDAETVTVDFNVLDAMEKVSVNPALTTFITYHFVAYKDNPRTADYLKMLNMGLAEMRETGEWYDIVATGLASQRPN